jgi:hypothetical protein
MQAATVELEEKLYKHLQAVFGHWACLSQPTKAELWHLKLARAMGHKDHIISCLKSHAEQIQQENTHLRAQVEQLSRCQQPREFQTMPPSTIPISNKALIEIYNLSTEVQPVGLTIKDKEEPLEVVVEQAISRWLTVVQSIKQAQSGLTSQQVLNGQSLNQGIGQHLTPSQEPNHNQNHVNAMGSGHNNQDTEMSDIDAEGEENLDDLSSAEPGQLQGRQPEAPISMLARQRYGNGNGNSKSETSHDGTKGNGNRNIEIEGLRQYCGHRVRM